MGWKCGLPEKETDLQWQESEVFGQSKWDSAWRENVGQVVNGFIRMRTNSTCFYVDGNDLVTWEKLMMQQGDYRAGDGIGSRV